MEIVYDLLYIVALTAAGYFTGEIVAKINLPRVLGYLLAGMILGPYAIGFVSIEFLDSPLMKAFLLISIGFVGALVGAGIHIDELKKSGKATMVIGLFEAYAPFFLVTLMAYVLFGWDLIAAMVVGSIALATAPAMALSISQEYKTDGPVTRTLLPIVAIDDVLAVATFGILLAFADAFYSGAEISVIDPFIEIFLSIGLGGLFGFVSYYIFKEMKNKKLILVSSMVILLIVMLIGLALHAELFMVGIAFGIIVLNLFNKEQRKLFNDSTEKFGGIAMIIFMVLIGSTLDITALLSLTALVGALIYMIARAAGKIGGAYSGSKLMKAPKTVQKYLGFTLLPAAGITLTFVGLASPVLPSEYSSILGIVVAAAALINEIIAVFAIKWAFGKADEIGKA